MAGEDEVKDEKVIEGDTEITEGDTIINVAPAEPQTETVPAEAIAAAVVSELEEKTWQQEITTKLEALMTMLSSHHETMGMMLERLAMLEMSEQTRAEALSPPVPELPSNSESSPESGEEGGLVETVTEALQVGIPEKPASARHDWI